MKDQKPQRGEALDLCILFPLNINTPVRQMRLQLPLYTALLPSPEAAIQPEFKPGGIQQSPKDQFSPEVLNLPTEAGTMIDD